MSQLHARRPRDDKQARSAAFGKLHSEHAVGVYNLALRLVGNRDDARDITQEVLLKAYQRLDGPRELERSWFYKVTVNACYDHLRRVKARPQAAEDPPEIAAAIDGYEQAELLNQVDWTLRQLPPTQRAALLLREVHGLQTDEVASALGVQPDSAAVTLTRARTTFRRHFAAISGLVSETGTDTAKVKRPRKVATVLGGSSAAAFSFILPGLTLPQVALPPGLDPSTLLAASAAAPGIGATLSTAASGPGVGIISRIAELLSTKAAAIGAGATLVTGTIGGAVAVEKATRPPAPAKSAVAAEPEQSQKPTAGASAIAQNSSGAKPATPGSSPAAHPSGSASPSGAASPSTSPSASADPGTPTPTPTEVAKDPTPTPDPSPTTIGETTPTPTPTPESSTPSPSPSSPSPGSSALP
jgi:RNA polymerase sigma-70 factor (ECF subfamily)